MLHLRREFASRLAGWLASNPGVVPHSELRCLIRALYESDRDRRIVVDELKELIKAEAPPIDELVLHQASTDHEIGFEQLAGLFASNTLNELHITMNIRQSAYLFGLIRRTQSEKIIEIGRHWGGSTILIAAALAGRGEFWSIADPTETDWDVANRNRQRPRPIAEQIEDVLSRAGLQANIVSGNPKDVEVQTGQVDLVHIDAAKTYDGAWSDFERFGLRVRPGGAVLLDDAVPDPFSETDRTKDVKRVAADIARGPDFRVVEKVQRLIHFERIR